MKNRANRLLWETMQEAMSLFIPIGNIKNDVVISTALSRWGQCRKVGLNGFEISISKHLLENGEDHKVKQTLMHEILHTAPGCFNHGATWKRYGSQVNRIYGYDISRTTSAANLGVDSPKVANAKYTIQCCSCGVEIHRTKATPVTKNPEKYRCKCGGNLVVK
jgi:predicted SprT family Zn-dependent metalloprotease